MPERSICTAAVLAAITVLLVSCGGTANMTKDCNPTALVIFPANGTADHTALAPGDQVQYSGMEQLPPGCVQTALVPVLTWTTSDATNTSIGNAPAPATPGLATCINATSQPATITGSLPGGSLKGTATLTCK